MAVNYLYKTSGKIIISGIGKSGHIGSKISSTLSSIGSSSFFLHPSEANHGDLGMIKKEGLYNLNIKFWRKFRVIKFNFIL